MLVRIIKTELVEKPKYKAQKVTYKNLESGKVLSANVVNFGDQLAVFNALGACKPNDTFNVTVVKNGDFFNWIKMEPAEAPADEPAADAPAAGRRGTTTAARDFESASERALKQILIVRQSSVAALLASPFGTQKDLDTVLKLAEKLEAWVFRDLKASDKEVNVEDAMKELLAMKDDVPV